MYKLLCTKTKLTKSIVGKIRKKFFNIKIVIKHKVFLSMEVDTCSLVQFS